MNKRLEVVVNGRVQGVGFRAFVFIKALELGLKGFAKNLPGGAVLVVAEGDEGRLYDLLVALHKGTPLCRVDGVSQVFTNVTNEFLNFMIK